MTARRLSRHDGGRIHVTVAILTTAVMVVAGLGVDGGQTLAAQSRAYSIAADAARTGAQQINPSHYRSTGQAVLDPAAARQAAADRLALVGATGQATATTVEVSVTVWRTHPTTLLGIAGVDTITVAATATAQVRHGITTGADVP
jgi:Flp pilus assembly protein TadG